MFVVEEVIFQNVKKKVKNIIPCRCNRRAQKKGPKNWKFFQIRYFSHIKFAKNVFKDFFHIQRSNDNSRNKIRFSAQF